VLIANSNLVGKWANWEHFNELDRKGLMMYGQMTAGSWIYIGTQGILQGTFQTFAALAEKHFGGGSLKGKLVVTGGVGGMGGAQPLSVTLNGGVVLAIDVDRSRIERRVETRYCDTGHRGSRRSTEAVRGGQARGPRAFGGTGWQLRRRAAGAGAARRRGGRGDRPDQRPRSAERLCATGTHVERSSGVAPARSRGVCAPFHGFHGGARGCDAGLAAGGRNGLRLRQ
jgi:hypothetical protein